MALEGYWSVLKKNILLLHNRPRVDFVVFILSKLLLRWFSDFENVLNRVLKPNWWRRFPATSKCLADTQVRGSYATDYRKWICSFPSYLNNEFLLYKHLVLVKSVAEYRSLNRLGKPPSFLIGNTAMSLFPKYPKRI